MQSGSDASAPLSAAQHTQVALVEELYRLGRPLVIMFPLNALFLAVVVWLSMPTALVVAWCSLILLLTAARFVLTRQFSRRREQQQVACWRNRYIGLEVLCGTTLGGLGYSLPYLTDAAGFLVLLTALLIMAGAGVVLAPVRFAYVGFATPAALLLAAGILVADGGMALPLSLMVVACALMLGLLSCGYHRVMKTSFQLRFTNEQLVDDLRQQRQKADQANAAKSAFLAHMCHEIRTPMHGMLASLELLGAQGLAGEQRHWQQTALQSGQRLLSLLNDILDLSKVEHGHLQPTPAVFSPQRLVEEAAQLMRASAEHKGLQLQLGVAGLPPTLESDPGWLRQILLNLLGNAIKFSDSGVIRLEAALHRERLSLRITDQGRGMSPEQVARLFIPYTQFEAQDQQHGSGLGLAISQKLARQLGGELTVESALDQGSCFELSVPVTVVEQALAEQADDTAPGAHQGMDLASMQILLVEDDPISGRVAVAMLAELGVSVDWVDNGQRALDQLHAQTYDLVLMDWQMPVLNGLEATRKLRLMPEGQRLAVVILTAHVTSGDELRCLQAGADEVVAKPLGQAGLQRLLQRYSRSSGRENRAA